MSSGWGESILTTDVNEIQNLWSQNSGFGLKGHLLGKDIKDNIGSEYDRKCTEVIHGTN